MLRLQKEWREVQSNGEHRWPDEKNESIIRKSKTNGELILYPTQPPNLFNWSIWITGPPETPYAGYRFEFRLGVPSNYPHVPPRLTAVTRMAHPNIHLHTGEVCLDVLKSEWSPVWTLAGIARATLLLLRYPEPLSPLNCDAANILRAHDMRAFNSLVRSYCEEYAVPIESSEKAHG